MRDPFGPLNLRPCASVPRAATFGASQPRSLLPASLKLISYDYTSPIKHDPHGPRSPSRAAAIAAASALAELDRIRTPTPLERAVKVRRCQR